MMSRNKSINYTTLGQLYDCSTDSITTNPYALSLENNINKSFDNGVNAYNYNQNNKYSQAYMAQTCSGEWSDICELASESDKPTLNSLYSGGAYYPFNDTLGTVTLRNTALEKFFIRTECSIIREKLNPVDSTSPDIKMYSGECKLIPNIDLNTIDNDPVMNKLLENNPVKHRSPMKFIDILMTLYNGMKAYYQIDLTQTNTKLGMFLKQYFITVRNM